MRRAPDLLSCRDQRDGYSVSWSKIIRTVRAHFEGKPVSRADRHGFTFSRVGTSGKLEAVHYHRGTVSSMLAREVGGESEIRTPDNLIALWAKPNRAITGEP
jgi:hypothetical protein